MLAAGNIGTMIQELLGFISARSEIYEDENFLNSYIEKNPWYQEFIDHQNEMVMFNPPGMLQSKIPEVRSIWYKYYEEVLYGNMDPTEAMGKAQEEASALF